MKQLDDHQRKFLTDLRSSLADSRGLNWPETIKWIDVIMDSDSYGDKFPDLVSRMLSFEEVRLDLIKLGWEL